MKEGSCVLPSEIIFTRSGGLADDLIRQVIDRLRQATRSRTPFRGAKKYGEAVHQGATPMSSLAAGAATNLASRWLRRWCRGPRIKSGRCPQKSGSWRLGGIGDVENIALIRNGNNTAIGEHAYIPDTAGDFRKNRFVPSHLFAFQL